MENEPFYFLFLSIIYAPVSFFAHWFKNNSSSEGENAFQLQAFSKLSRWQIFSIKLYTQNRQPIHKAISSEQRPNFVVAARRTFFIFFFPAALSQGYIESLPRIERAIPPRKAPSGLLKQRQGPVITEIYI